VRTRSYKLLAVFLGGILLLPVTARARKKRCSSRPASSMPEPLYKNWIDEFHQQQPSTEIRYMATGTAESARNILQVPAISAAGMLRFRRPNFTQQADRFLNCPPS